MLSPPIPCKGLRPLTHSRDFVGYVCIQLPRADFALIYNLLMSIGESLSTFSPSSACKRRCAMTFQLMKVSLPRRIRSSRPR